MEWWNTGIMGSDKQFKDHYSNIPIFHFSNTDKIMIKQGLDDFALKGRNLENERYEDL
jgi:hypothetical protein